MTSYTPIKLAYEITEPEKSANLNDIIIIHGLTQSYKSWSKLVKKFANLTGRRVYALDMRNHGDSQWTEDFSIDIQVKDVLHFMDEKHIKQAILIGHSMGAKISMELALAKPERVEKLVSEDLGPEAIPLSDVMAVFEQAINAIPPDVDLQEAQEKMAQFMNENLPDRIKVKTETYNVPLVKKEGRYVAKCNLHAINTWTKKPDAFPASKGICTIPALFIYGTLSRLQVNKDKDRIMEIFPNSKLYAVEGATHMVHDEYPDEFTEVVLKFLIES